MLLLPLLAACGGADPEPDETGGAPIPCDLTLSVSVTDGATDVPGNRPVRVTLSEPDTTASIDGSVAGVTTRSEDGLTLTWTPEPAIDPLTDVALDIQTCKGTASVSYRTSDLGGPLDAGVDLAGTGFRIDLAAGTILRPATGTALFALLADQGTEVLLGLTPAEVADTAVGNADNLDVLLAVATDGVQDTCSRTLAIAGGSLDRGWFDYGPGAATFYVYDATVQLEGLSFGGAVRADGSAVEAAWIRGWVGVEPLAALYAGGDIEQACGFFEGLGAPCEPCPTSGGSCLALEIEDLSGPATGAPVVPVASSCDE